MTLTSDSIAGWLTERRRRRALFCNRLAGYKLCDWTQTEMVTLWGWLIDQLIVLADITALRNRLLCRCVDNSARLSKYYSILMHIFSIVHSCDIERGQRPNKSKNKRNPGNHNTIDRPVWNEETSHSNMKLQNIYQLELIWKPWTGNYLRILASVSDILIYTDLWDCL